jgi:hypothetical protein
MQSEALNEDILASAQGYLPDSNAFGKHVNICKYHLPVVPHKAVAEVSV